MRITMVGLAGSACLLTRSLLGQADTNVPTDRAWGRQAAGFQLSIAAESSTYRMGSGITLEIVIRNVDSVRRRLAWTSPLLFYRIDVQVPTPEWIPLRPRAALTEYGLEETGKIQKLPKRLDYRGFYLMPQGEERTTVQLNRLYHMQVPGTYRIRVDCTPPGSGDVVLSSNEITVTILAPPNQ